MAFWKKNEDPWDIGPAKKRREEPVSLFEAEPAEKPERLLAGLFKKKVPEAPPAPIPCPYCGEQMEVGYLSAGGMIIWTAEKPGVFMGTAMARERICVSDEGELVFYKTCHVCQSCRKLVADVPEMERIGPNYEWKDGKVVLPEDEKKDDL